MKDPLDNLKQLLKILAEEVNVKKVGIPYKAIDFDGKEYKISYELKTNKFIKDEQII